MRPGSEGDLALTLPERHRQFPLFDSLRALAAISILIVHTAIFSGAVSNSTYGRFLLHLDIGVSFFFLLSAFLLYRPFVAARVLGTPRTPLASYARRRFLRIAPAYWVVLTVAAIVPGFAGVFSGNWWVYYGLLQNFPVYTPEGTCAVDPYRCGIPTAWSLAIEVGFYAVLPLFVLAMDRIGRRRNGKGWFRTELWAVLAISVVAVVIMSLPPNTDLRLWLFYSPLGRGWWFGLGLALAALSVWVEQQGAEPAALARLRQRPWIALAGAAGLYVFVCFALNGSLSAFPVDGQLGFVLQYLIFGLIALLVLLPAAFGIDGGGLFRQFLAHRTLAWLGLISYGIFLWQFPVMFLLLDETSILGFWPGMSFPVLTLATFAGTVACATLSYYVVERPLMRRRSASTGLIGAAVTRPVAK